MKSLFEVKHMKPNATTLSALAEYKEMKEHPERYKKYHSFEEILNDLDKKDDV